MPIPTPSVSSKARSRLSKTNWNALSQPQSSQLPPQDGTAEQEASNTESLGTRSSIARPLSFHGEVDGAKRRSFLPQPGQPRYNTRSSLLPSTSNQSLENREVIEDPTISNEQQCPLSPTKENKVNDAIAQRLRPRSMYQTRTASPERARNIEEATTLQSMRPTALVNKFSESQVPALGRSQSLRKPGITTQPIQPTTAAAHSRARSIHSTIPNQTAPTRSIVAPEKPKSLPVAPSSSVRAHSGFVDTVLRGTRASARLQGSGRSVNAKAGSEVLNGSNAKRLPKEEHAVAIQPRRREPTQEEPKKTARPAFSTLQQHFTPRKVGKAPTATFLHPPSAIGATFLAPDVVNLQTELLQLHMLHDGSVQLSKRWELSAQRSLHKKFEEVASLYQAMLEDEHRGLEQKNLHSLLEWSTGGASGGLTEYIQILSEPLHELPVLLESGGRLHSLVADFDAWISRTQVIRSARQEFTQSPDAKTAIETLGDSWQAENAAMVRKLTALARDLDKLDQPSAGSSIAYIVETCKQLLEGILDELHTMQSIASVVAAKEREWVEDRLQSIARDKGAHMVDTSGGTPLWRS